MVGAVVDVVENCPVVDSGALVVVSTPNLVVDIAPAVVGARFGAVTGTLVLIDAAVPVLIGENVMGVVARLVIAAVVGGT